MERVTIDRIVIYGKEDVYQHLEECKISQFIMDKVLLQKAARYENHENLDVICIPKGKVLDGAGNQQCIYVFLNKETILFVCDDKTEIERLIESCKEEGRSEAWWILYEFFEKLIETEQKAMEHLEASMAKLEDGVLLERQNIKPLDEIVKYRKKLLSFKRYMEQLSDMFSYINANENQLFERKSLRYFKIQGGRADRLYQSVLVLRDYATQIREAYQSEVDINLNKTMKFFTVLATIFMPLTLLVGWYGMNFDMPEFHWRYGYASVIALSCICVTSCIYLFKKKMWF